MILDKQKQEFLAKCLTLLEVKGVVLDDEFILGNTSKCIIYRDQLLYMCISIDYNNFEVERLRNKNTILMTQNKKIIKFDNEFILLEDHINDMTSDMNVNLDRVDFPPEEPVFSISR